MKVRISTGKLAFEVANTAHTAIEGSKCEDGKWWNFAVSYEPSS